MTSATRTWLIAGGIMGFLAGSVFLASSPADADRTVILSSAGARITHGDWARLDDGGFRFSVCGTTDQVDGGRGLALEEPCVVCEPGGWNTAPATCRAAWRAANGL